jgi:hypothetical protein
MPDHYLCVHASFYQPPRGNPFADDEIGDEPGHEPHRNLNEKVNAECYAPNARLGNFDLLSFNFGSTLLRWLEEHAPETYPPILAADRANLEKWGTGNAIAQPVHHTILPLCRERDETLQVRWGLMSFEQRFGRPAEGMWLPEMAVDVRTLQTLYDHGVKFTVLAQAQVKGAVEGAGPYWVKVPSGGRLAVYVRDDYHSTQLAYEVRTLGGAGRWARGTLAPLKRSYGRLFLIALAGETFGHHHAGEEHFLHWLLAYEAGAIGFEVTSLARDLRDHPPEKEIEINEYTSWSCPHGLARWSTGCECTPGDSRWKGALRRAFDNLANGLDDAYVYYCHNLGVDPWPLREMWFRVRMGQITEGLLLREAGLTRLTAPQANGLLSLLRSQFHRQRMYMSHAFFFGDLDRPEPRYAIANAVRALLLVKQTTGDDFSSEFRRDLALAAPASGGKTGAAILDDVMAQARESGAA